MPKEQTKEKIKDILNEEMYNYGQAINMAEKDEIYNRTCTQLLEFLSRQEKKILEELLKELPKEYEDKKLGRTDLTLNEMFERGYNSAKIQIKNLIKQKLKELK